MRKIKCPKEKAYFFLGAILYVIALRLLNITCIIYAIFHIYCPGCGMTRAFFSALLFDYQTASRYHPLWFFSPLIFMYILFDGYLFGIKVDRFLITAMGLSFLIVWVLRLAGVLTLS